MTKQNGGDEARPKLAVIEGGKEGERALLEWLRERDPTRARAERFGEIIKMMRSKGRLLLVPKSDVSDDK